MLITARLSLIAICLLGTTVITAQMPDSTSEARARAIFSRTKAGQEQQVVCDELDEGVGRAFLSLASETMIPTPSLEQMAVAARLAERTARCIDSDSLLGAALNAVSNLLLGLTDFDGAVAVGKESVALHIRLHDDIGLAEAWNRIGNAEWWRNDSAAASDAFTRALALSMAAHDRVGQARAWNNLGTLHKAEGELEAALDELTRALAVFQDLGDRTRAAVVTNNIGLVYFNRGEYDKALEYNGRALALNRAIDNRFRLGASFDSAGNIYRALGAYRQALEAFRQALALRAASGDRAGIMETTHNIGLVHLSQGDYQLAIDAFKHGLRLNRGIDDQTFVSEALRNIGAAAWQLGEKARATANFRESLAIARARHLRWNEGEIVHDLGQMAFADGHLANAMQLFNEALAIRRDIGDQSGITEALSSLASTRLTEGQHEAALNLAREAVDNATGRNQSELLWRAQTVAGLAYRRLHRPDEARRALTDAIRSVEQLSNGVSGSENLRQRFFEDKLSPYHELIALSLGERSVDEALELAERSKARVLAQLLRGNRADDSSILTASENRERGRLRDALVALNRKIEIEQEKKAPDASRIGGLESARSEARVALAAFEAKLPIQHPELEAVRGAVKPFTLEDANRIVADVETALIEYVVADRQLFAFLLTNDHGRIVVDGRAIDVTAADVARRAERFRLQIASRDFGVADDAQTLYGLLLAPFNERLAGKKRLIVVPDGALWNVPFHALKNADGYVIEQLAVSYAPSMTVLREIQRLPRPAGPRTLMAMGKAQFGSASASSLDPLPDAELQVRLLRDVYGRDRSVTYLGNEATESRFRAEAPRYTVLHLATHGVLDEAGPLYSHFVLSPDTSEDDGRLEAWEIMRMKLPAEVVVLAACDTGRGRVAPGEGVIGTMWALLAAGARSMVVSQFRVESKSATGLLVAFHRRLATGRGSKAADLQSAALELLRTPRYAHPYYWAGFMLLGDPD